jgi:hypothetical protein
MAKGNPTRTASFWSHSRSASLVLVAVAVLGLRNAGANTLLNPLPEDSTTLFGAAIAAVGDLDGDGGGDLAVGSPFQDGDFVNSSTGFGPPQNVGKVFLLSGATLAVLHQLDDPDFQKVQSLKFGGHFGEAVAAAGDLTGDGVSEVLVGNPHHIVGQRESSIFNAGRAFVFNGATGSILFTLDDPDPQEGARCGTAVAGLGDVNQDGTPDLMVGVPKRDTDAGDDVGTVYIFSGANGSLLRTLTPPADGGAEANDRFGYAVANADDVNHDGVSDLLIGAPGGSRAYVYNGASGALLFTLNSPVVENLPSFGFAVAGGQDLDSDGTPDFAIGAPLQKSLAGAAYTFSGATGALLKTLRNTRQQYSKFGGAVALSADLTGDRRPDVLVGIPDQIVNGLSNAGEIQVFRGRNGRLFQTITSAAPTAFAGFGSAIATADFDQDGTVKTIVGAPFQNADIVADDGDIETHLQIGQIEIQ